MHMYAHGYLLLINTLLHTHSHTQPHSHTYTEIHANTHTLIHTHTYTHIQTHTHTQAHTKNSHKHTYIDTFICKDKGSYNTIACYLMY